MLNTQNLIHPTIICSRRVSPRSVLRRLFILPLFIMGLTLAACSSSQSGDDGVIQLSGSVEAREVDLAFQIGGRISQLNVEEGSWIKEGELVANIDATDLQLVLQQTTATANAAKANLEALKSGTRKQEIRVAEADLQKAQSQLNYSMADVKRISTLVPKKLASDEQLEQSQLQYEIALASVEQTKQKLNLLKEGARSEDIPRAEQQFIALDEASAIARQQLTYTNLMSPVTGMVTVRLSEAGEVVGPGQSVVRIAETTHPWVRAYLNETQLGKVKVGQSVKVKIDSLPEKEFSGTLSFISPVAEFTPKTVETKALRVDLVYRIKVEVENPEGILKIGMPADIFIETGQAHVSTS